MEEKEFKPVWTTELFDETGVKLVYDANKNMYLYREEGEDIGNGTYSSFSNSWGLSPSLVEDYLKEGALSYTDPKELAVKKEEPALECECEGCPDQCDEPDPIDELGDKLDRLNEKLEKLIEVLTPAKEKGNATKKEKK